MPIQGLRSTAQFTATGERPENWRQGLLMLYPNSANAAKAPLVALTSMMKERVVDDPSFHWFEKELDDRRIELHATNGDLAASGGVGTLTLTATSDARKVKQGDILRVEQTGELLEVLADPSSLTSVSVRRGFAGSTPASVDANGAGINPFIMIVGSAYEEGSLPPSGQAYDPAEKNNYTQIFRQTVEITGTAKETNLRTEDPYKENKREQLEYLGIDMERAFFFGKKSIGSRNGKPLRTMDGLLSFIPNTAGVNRFTPASGGVADMEELEEWMFQIFRYGSSEKLVLGGGRVLLAIQQIVRKNSTYNIQGGLTEYGMKVTRITSPFGELVFKNHPLFTQAIGGVTTAVAFHGDTASAFVLDMANIKYVYLKNRDVKFMDKLEAPGMDGTKAGWLGECSLEVHHAKTHSYIYGLVGGKADS